MPEPPSTQPLTPPGPEKVALTLYFVPLIQDAVVGAHAGRYDGILLQCAIVHPFSSMRVSIIENGQAQCTSVKLPRFGWGSVEAAVLEAVRVKPPDDKGAM